MQLVKEKLGPFLKKSHWCYCWALDEKTGATLMTLKARIMLALIKVNTKSCLFLCLKIQVITQAAKENTDKSDSVNKSQHPERIGSVRATDRMIIRSANVSH